jgi:hypothetical protein
MPYRVEYAKLGTCELFMVKGWFPTFVGVLIPLAGLSPTQQSARVSEQTENELDPTETIRLSQLD